MTHRAGDKRATVGDIGMTSGATPRAGALAMAIAGAAALVYCFAVLYLHGLTPHDGLSVLHGTLTTEGREQGTGRPVDLPSSWRRDCGVCTQAWYEFALPALSARENTAVFFPVAQPRFAVYLNGDLLEYADRDAAGLSSRSRGPRLARIPSAAIDPSDNRLLVFVQGDVPGDGALSTLFIGSATSLAPYYRLRDLLQPGAARFSAVFCVVVGMLMLALWAQRREHREYAWLSALALLWAVVNWPDMPVGGDLGRWVQAAALALLAATAGRFADLFAPARRTFDIRLPGIALLATLALGCFLLVTRNAYPLLLHYWAAFWLLALALGQAALARRVSRRGMQASWTAVPAAVVVVFALRDASVAIGLTTSIDEATLSFAAPVYVGAFAWLLLTRFIDTLRTTQELNVQLDEMVRAKAAEIERQYDRMRVMESERVLSDERERIMRDMHDGVGGQLVSAMALIDKDTQSQSHSAGLREALSGALTDMRLMIDSLESVDGNLNAVLAMFRDRMQSRLTAAGVDLEWQVGDLPSIDGLGPSNALNVLRIMQETVTNTLKHAAADRIIVVARAVANSDAVEIEISDNGRGFDPASASGRGHGLGNMHKRARENGIELALASAPGKGSTVRMLFHPGRNIDGAPEAQC